MYEFCTLFPINLSSVQIYLYPIHSIEGKTDVSLILSTRTGIKMQNSLMIFSLRLTKCNIIVLLVIIDFVWKNKGNN